MGKAFKNQGEQGSKNKVLQGVRTSKARGDRSYLLKISKAPCRSVTEKVAVGRGRPELL